MKAEWYKRYVEIKELSEAGVNNTEIAKKYGLKLQRISQILKRGVKPPVSFDGELSSAQEIYTKRHNHSQRMKIIVGLGGKCVSCGFSDFRALQVDHIRGGGVKEHKKLGAYYLYKQIREMIKDGTAHLNYQLLCSNCNWIKRYEQGETR